MKLLGSPWRSVALALLGLLGAASASCMPSCSSASKRKSPTALASSGRWQRAHVEIELTPEGTRHSTHGKSRWVSAQVTHWLQFERDADTINPAHFIIVNAFADDVGKETFEKLKGAEYTLKFSPDGGSVAISTNGGGAWTLVDIEHMDSKFHLPFYCRHRQVSSLDPWPSSRAVVLEVLSEAGPDSATHAHKAPDQPEWPSLERVGASGLSWLEELRGAMLYACARKDDAELVAAVVDAYLQPGNIGSGDGGGSNSVLGVCMGDLARRDPAVLARFRAAAAGDDSRAKTALYFFEGDKPVPSVSASAPPSAVQPSAVQPSAVQPSAVAPSAVQPGATAAPAP